jgi:hypothetical protein
MTTPNTTNTLRTIATGGRSTTVEQARKSLKGERAERLKAKKEDASRGSIADATVAPNVPATASPPLARRASVDQPLPPALNPVAANESSAIESSAAPAALAAVPNSLTEGQQAQLESLPGERGRLPAPTRNAPKRTPSWHARQAADRDALARADTLTGRVSKSAEALSRKDLNLKTGEEEGLSIKDVKAREDLLQPVKQLAALFIEHEFDLESMSEPDLSGLIGNLQVFRERMSVIPSQSMGWADAALIAKLDATTRAVETRFASRIAQAYPWHTRPMPHQEAMEKIEQLAKAAKDNTYALRRNEGDTFELLKPSKELMTFLVFTQFDVGSMPDADLQRLSAAAKEIDFSRVGFVGSRLVSVTRNRVNTIETEVKNREAQTREREALLQQQARQRVLGAGPVTAKSIAARMLAPENLSLANRTIIASVIEEMAKKEGGVTLLRELVMEIQNFPADALGKLSKSDPVKLALTKSLELMDLKTFDFFNKRLEILEPALQEIFRNALTLKAQQKLTTELLGPVVQSLAVADPKPGVVSAHVQTAKRIHRSIVEQAALGPSELFEFGGPNGAMANSLAKDYGKTTGAMLMTLGGKAQDEKHQSKSVDRPNDVSDALKPRFLPAGKDRKQQIENLQLVREAVQSAVKRGGRG